jgi:2-keto-4-pentenoate hydratase/2-oxohepta-3-ene-1,7-dioic acid hydratase in catechol pathway
VVDAAQAARALRGTPGEPSTVRGVLALSERLAELEAAARQTVPVAAIDSISLGPPVPDPEKILCIGLNYVEHADETRLDVPPVPTVFAKFRNSLIGHGSPILVPAATQEVDFEGELAVVVGKRCRRVRADEALPMIAGVMPLNDVSARDLQMQTSQWTAGKAVDTFAPCGPQLVLLDEIRDLQDLRVQTQVNGETVQDARTSQMIFSIAEIVAFLSSVMTLEVGDIIATGTPSGVGFTRQPPRFLKAGDRVQVDIENVGVLSNLVALEQSA